MGYQKKFYAGQMWWSIDAAKISDEDLARPLALKARITPLDQRAASEVSLGEGKALNGFDGDAKKKCREWKKIKARPGFGSGSYFFSSIPNCRTLPMSICANQCSKVLHLVEGKANMGSSGS